MSESRQRIGLGLALCALLAVVAQGISSTSASAQVHASQDFIPIDACQGFPCLRASFPARVRVRAPLRVTGRVRGLREPTPLALERRVGRGWRLVARTRTRRAGRFAFIVRIRVPGEVRLRVRGVGRLARLTWSSDDIPVLRPNALALEAPRRLPGGSGTAVDPAIAANPDDGSFLVVWSRAIAGRHQLEAVVIGPDGAPRTARPTSIPGARPDSRPATVAWNSVAKRWLIAWVIEDGDGRGHLVVSHLNAQGTPLQPTPTSISEDGGVESYIHPHVACGPANGACLVSWAYSTAGRDLAVAVRELSEGGSASGPVTTLPYGAANGDHDITWNAVRGEWLATWGAADGRLVAQTIAVAGMPSGASLTVFRPSPRHPDVQTVAAVANPVSGEYLLGANISGRIRPGLRPFRLDPAAQRTLAVSGYDSSRAETGIAEDGWACDAAGRCLGIWKREGYGLIGQVATPGGAFVRGQAQLGLRAGRDGRIAWNAGTNRWMLVYDTGTERLSARSFSLRAP